METFDKCCLRRNRVKLLKCLEAKDVINFLCEDETLSFSDCDDVLSGRTSKERCRLLLDILPKRGPHAYRSFIKALKSAKYEYLVESLRSTNDAAMATLDLKRFKLPVKETDSVVLEKIPNLMANVVENVEPNDILDFFYQEHALSEDECEEIRQYSTRKQRCFNMIQKISMKNFKVHSILLESLRNTKYDFILHVNKERSGERTNCPNCCSTSVSRISKTGKLVHPGNNLRLKHKVDAQRKRHTIASLEKQETKQIVCEKSNKSIYMTTIIHSEIETQTNFDFQFVAIGSSVRSPLEQSNTLLMAFNYLSTLINQGRFSHFEIFTQRLQNIYRTNVDLQYMILYLRASRELFRCNSDNAITHIKAAENIIPKTSNPLYFTVELLSAKSRMRLNERQFLKFQSIFHDAQMMIESFPTQCIGHAVGWLYLNNARCIMTQIDCLNFRKSSAFNSLKCLKANAEQSLYKSIEQFRRDTGNDGPFGLGYALCRLAVLLLQCGANGRLMGTLRPSIKDINNARRCVKSLEGMETGVPKMLMMHINLAKTDFNFRINSIKSAIKFANSAKELSEKFDMKEYAEHANTRISFLMQHHGESLLDKQPETNQNKIFNTH